MMEKAPRRPRASPLLIGGTRGEDGGGEAEPEIGNRIKGPPLSRSATWRKKKRKKWLSDRSGKQICTKFNACRKGGRTDETHTRSPGKGG